MADSIVGQYKQYKNEYIDEYFAAIGVPYVARKMMGISSPLLEISVDADVWTVRSSTLMRTVETKFKLGEKYDERMPDVTIQSVTRLEGNELVTESQVPADGTRTMRRYAFDGDECVLTMTHPTVATPARRYFRRVKK